MLGKWASGGWLGVNCGNLDLDRDGMGQCPGVALGQTGAHPYRQNLRRRTGQKLEILDLVAIDRANGFDHRRDFERVRSAGRAREQLGQDDPALLRVVANEELQTLF